MNYGRSNYSSRRPKKRASAGKASGSGRAYRKTRAAKRRGYRT